MVPEGWYLVQHCANVVEPGTKGRGTGTKVTVKALLSPRGAYLISDLPEGGLNREGGLLERGGLFTKSSDKDIFGSFSVLLSHSLRNQGTILRLKYVNSTQSLFQSVPKLTWKVV